MYGNNLTTEGGEIIISHVECDRKFLTKEKNNLNITNHHKPKHPEIEVKFEMLQLMFEFTLTEVLNAITKS